MRQVILPKKRPDPNAINLRCKVNYGKGLGRNDLGVFKISGIVLAILGPLFSVVLQLYADGKPSFLPDHFSYKSLFCNLLHLKLMAFGSGLFLLPFSCFRPIVNSPSKLASRLEKTRASVGWRRFAHPGDKRGLGSYLGRVLTSSLEGKR